MWSPGIPGNTGPPRSTSRCISEPVEISCTQASIQPFDAHTASGAHTAVFPLLLKCYSSADSQTLVTRTELNG